MISPIYGRWTGNHSLSIWVPHENHTFTAYLSLPSFCCCLDLARRSCSVETDGDHHGTGIRPDDGQGSVCIALYIHFLCRSELVWQPCESGQRSFYFKK